MNQIQNVNQNIASTLATQTNADGEAPVAARKGAAPLLGGASVTVTTAPTGDLEKLVARLKNESADVKTSMAKQRLASLLSAYADRYGALSAQQTELLEGIAENNDSISSKTAELGKLKEAEAAAKGRSLILDQKIAALEHAVAQAIEDGKTHRENVAKLKEQLARDTENEDIKARLAKETAAAAASEAALKAAETDLAAAKAAAGAVSAEIRSYAGAEDVLEGEIAALEASNASLAGKLGSQTVANLLAALGEEAPKAEVDRGPRPAEEEKAERKALENDPANLLREAMDRMDKAILQTIDEKRDQTV